MRIRSMVTAVLVSAILPTLFMMLCALLAADSAVGQAQDRIVVGPNVLVSLERSGSSGELLVAADPNNPQNLLASGILFRRNDPRSGQATRGYSSRDGGYSWNMISFPELDAESSGDPLVAYSRKGWGYFVSLGKYAGKKRIYVYRSEDGGATWGKPVELEGLYDHPQIVVDNSAGRFEGNVYLSALAFNIHGQRDYHIVVFRSRDSGRSWIGPIDVATNHDRPGRGVNAMNPVLFSDGELFVPFWEFGITNEARQADRSYRFYFVTSNDGGRTFSSSQRFVLQGGGEIVGSPGEAAVFAVDDSDGRFRDRIYIAWIERRSLSGGDPRSNQMSRLRISYSSDRGKNWSTPQFVTPWPESFDDLSGPPAIAVNRDGTVAVSWYGTKVVGTPGDGDRRMINHYLAASVDGGATFLPARRISSQPTDMERLRRDVVGAEVVGTSIVLLRGWHGHQEYLGLTADAKGTFHSVWRDGRTGTYQIWTARIRVEASNSSGVVESQKNLVEADVTDRVEAVLEPLREFPLAGTLELPIRLKNKSDQPVYGPIKMEVASLSRFPPSVESSKGEILNIMNTGNGKSGEGAVFDYTHALGGFESLSPGAISESVVWRFNTATMSRDLRSFKFKVTGRIERP